MQQTLKAGRTVMLWVVTAVAVAVMAYVNQRSSGVAKRSAVAPSPAAAPKALVAVKPLELETIEVYDTRSGMIEPWERYTLGFEVAGRVVEINFDQGDRVKKGQVLARLDDRILRARRSETAARLELAASDLRRTQNLKQRGIGAVTDAALQDDLTEMALAKAQHEMAVKNLEDAALVAPIDGRISKRLINTGETVNPHEPAFEIVEVDRLLLVLGVPESDLTSIEARRNQIAKNQKLQEFQVIDEADLKMKVYIELLGRGLFGKELPEMEGTVFHISETADDKTGLFEVEVELDNRQGLVKPGMVARAKIVTARTDGYRVPATSVIFRGNRASLFTVRPESAAVEAMFFPVGSQQVYRAEQIELQNWLEQSGEVLFSDAIDEATATVVRGQHRLIDGQFVEIVPSDEAPSLPAEPVSTVGASR
jgi:membrane fusion protein (multidrug efflux system)